MIIKNMKTAAEAVGINLFITNSEEKIETQLNRLTHQEDLPIMLVSWDIDVQLEFDQNGFIRNPDVNIVCLLLDKPEDMLKENAEETAENMAALYVDFLRELYKSQINVMKEAGVSPITNIGYKLVPRHGAAKHSGVLGRFTVQDEITEPCS